MQRYVHVPAPAGTTFKAVEADTCTYLGMFSLFFVFFNVGTPSGVLLFDHLLWSIYQLLIFTEKLLPLGFEPGTSPVPSRFATN